MSRITAKELIESALLLHDGQKFLVQCNSLQEMETLRSNLYRCRKVLLKTHKKLAYSLFISRETIQGNYFISISKEKTVKNVLIVNEDGSTEPFERSETEPAEILSSDSETRMRDLMKKDGLTEEEIEITLNQKGEDDFDKAATMLEEDIINEKEEI